MSDNGRIQCAGLVLAGGGAVRLGGVDKAQIQIGDQTLLLRAIEILGQFAETIAISGGPNPTGTKMHGHPILKDISPGGGPLAGIAAGLSWAAEEGFEWLAVMPVDAPFLDELPYLRLIEEASESPLLIAETSRPQWLASLWATRLAQDAGQAAAGEDKSIAHFAKMIGGTKIAMPELAPMFDNINTPEDLAKARARAVQNSNQEPRSNNV